MGFMKNPKNILVFLGSPGCGKTYCCAAMIEWIFTNYRTFRKHRELDLLSKLRESMSSDTDYSKTLELLIDDEFIILDDVGSGINPGKVSYKDLEWRREILFNFLDNRYNSMQPTIITSNLNKEQFEEVYSERISSRLFSAENKIITMFGKGLDQRQMGK